MSDEKPAGEGAGLNQAQRERQAKLEQALRANLRRRKAVAPAREPGAAQTREDGDA